MKIIHCFRSPVGGIFRHVRDLVKAQSEAGHEVGIICDSTTGGDYEDALFEIIKPQLSLGLHRIAMSRSITPRDFSALLKTRKILKQIAPDIVHSHSAKGGVYGRFGTYLARSNTKSVKTFYCPHGGAMHYDAKSLKGRIFFAAERFLEPYTTSLVFVSDYERKAYHEKVGVPRCSEEIVFNGLPSEEFEPVGTADEAVEFLYIGMKRDLKGPDVFLDALKVVRDKTAKDIRAYFVGDGPDEQKYNDQIEKLELKNAVTVRNAMPAREAFQLADIVVVPSRAESMPYLVLEAIAAVKPIVATNVGGIPEIFADQSDQLVEPGNADALALAMIKSLEDTNLFEKARKMQSSLKERFSLEVMAQNMEKMYLRQVT